MSSTQNEEVPFFKRTFLGIQYWIYALILIILIVWWAHRSGYFSGFTTGEKGTTSFAQKSQLQPITITPVETRLPM